MTPTTNYRYGSLTPAGERRTCEIYNRSGKGWIIPSLYDPLRWQLGTISDSGLRTVDHSETTRFVTRSYASRVLAHSANTVRAWRANGSPAAARRGEIWTSPVPLNEYQRADRHTVNYRTRDGVEYWSDISVIDYGATGYEHSNGVIEVGDPHAYLSRIDARARREPGYPVVTWAYSSGATGGDHTGWIKSDGRTIAEVVQCGSCGRYWDDAVTTGCTPTPSARCPFEYDHGDPIGRWYRPTVAIPGRTETVEVDQ